MPNTTKCSYPSISCEKQSTKFTSRFIAVVAVLLIVASCSSSGELTQRQELVAEAGALVMPFDLDATTHIFTETDTGSIQDVVADDPTDDANISLIREHLEDEAAKFQAGDFSDPEASTDPTCLAW